MTNTATPLLQWLETEGVTQRDFALACDTEAGIPVKPQIVWRWVRGRSLPSIQSRALIETVTKGAVKPAHWMEWADRAGYRTGNR